MLRNINTCITTVIILEGRTVCDSLNKLNVIEKAPPVTVWNTKLQKWSTVLYHIGTFIDWTKFNKTLKIYCSWPWKNFIVWMIGKWIAFMTKIGSEIAVYFRDYSWEQRCFLLPITPRFVVTFQQESARAHVSTKCPAKEKLSSISVAYIVTKFVSNGTEHSQIIRIGELDGVLQLEQNTVHRNDTQRRSSRRRIIANGGHTRDRLVFH